MLELHEHVETAENPGREPLGQELMNGDAHVRSDLLTRMRREFLEVPEPHCIEILDWLAEQGALSDGPPRVGYRPAQWQAAIVSILEYIFQHPALTDIYAVIYVWKQPLLDDILHHHNPAQFASKLNVSRQAVNDAVLRAQRYFKQEPRPCQRNGKSRMTQSRVRIANISKTTHAKNDKN